MASPAPHSPHPPSTGRRRRVSAAALGLTLASALTLLLAGFGLGGCDRSGAKNQLVIGMELSYQPFEMVDEKGTPTGIGVDMVRQLAASLHREPKIENIPFDGLITALKTGRIDLIVSSMTVRPDRAESIDFSDPYVTTGLGLLVGARGDVRSVADLDQPNRSVVTKTSTTGFLYVQEHFKHIQNRVLADEQNCALEVSQGKADAFLYDQIAVYRLHQRFPDTTRALLQPFQRESWAIGIRKGNDELRRQVNAFLADFKAKKGMEALNEKYLGSDKAAYREMGFPFPD